MQDIIETANYLKDARRAGLTDEELEASTLALAQTIARNAPLTIKAAKAAIDEAVGVMHPDADPITLADQCFDRTDAAEGRDAFLEKRNPVFTGR